MAALETRAPPRARGPRILLCRACYHDTAYTSTLFLIFLHTATIPAVPRLKKPSNPDVERKIAARFVELRNFWEMSLSEFAKEIGLTRDQVSNIERARSPLRYVNAVRALGADGRSKPGWPSLHPFNPLWLFGEDSPTQLSWPMLLPDPVTIGESITLRFSDFVVGNLALLQVFASDTPHKARLPESWLAAVCQHWTGRHLKASREFDDALTIFDILGPSALALAPASPPARRILQVIEKTSLGLGWLGAETDRVAQENPILQKESSKQVLTAISANANLSAVQSPLTQLLERLNQATAAKGAKAKLAEYLKAPRPCVSDWLSGKREPSGETTLRLLQWVEREERQQTKGPGSAITRPEPRTQSKASNEKKPPSGRKKD